MITKLLAFFSNAPLKTLKKFFLELSFTLGISSSKVGSTLSNDILFTGFDKISNAFVMHVK